MVGDSCSKDIEPAEAVGMKAIWTLHRPAREADDLVRVLDRAAPSPSRTVRSIGAVGVDLVREIRRGP